MTYHDKLWTSLLFGLVFVASAPAAIVSPSADILALVRQRSNIQNFTLQDLEVSEEDSLKVPLRLGDQTCWMILHRHRVRSERFEVWVQDSTGLHQIPPGPQVWTYRGYLAGKVSSSISARIYDARIDAVIQDGDGQTWVVKPGSRVLADQGCESSHIVYRAEDTIPTGGVCGVEGHDPLTICEIPPPPTEIDLDAIVCEIGCDADFEFFQWHDSDVEAVIADIEMIINGVSEIYERDAGVAFEITRIVVRTAEPDPYSVTNPYSLLGVIENEWVTHQGDVSFDVVQLFSGKDFQGSPIGIAEEDAVCRSGPSAIQANFSADLVERIALSAHEIGHTFDAVHCDYSDSNCRIMCSTMGGCSEGYKSFCNANASRIRATALTKNCLSPGVIPTTGTEIPFFDDFSYCRTVPKDPDPERWCAADRAQGSYSRMRLSIGKDYGGNQRYSTLRTRPMKVEERIVASYQVCQSYVPTRQSLLVEYFNSTLYQWQLLEKIDSTGVGTSEFTYHEHAIPSDGWGPYFALRFTTTGSGTTGSLYWLLDDVSVQAAPLAADLDKDSDVDEADFAILSAAWLSSAGEPAWNALCDVYDPPDETINLQDLMILVLEWLEGKL